VCVYVCVCVYIPVFDSGNRDGPLRRIGIWSGHGDQRGKGRVQPRGLRSIDPILGIADVVIGVVADGARRHALVFRYPAR